MNYHLPCCLVSIVNTDYEHIKAKVRQKMSKINHLLISLNHISGFNYKMYIDTDYIMLVNMTLNKVIFCDEVNHTFAATIFKLENLLTMHEYEHKPFHTIYEHNHYLSLKQHYYG